MLNLNAENLLIISTITTLLVVTIAYLYSTFKVFMRLKKIEQLLASFQGKNKGDNDSNESADD